MCLDRPGLLAPRDRKVSRALRAWQVSQARGVGKALLVLLGRRAPQAQRAILVPRDLRFCSHTVVSLTQTWRGDVSPASSW